MKTVLFTVVFQSLWILPSISQSVSNVPIRDIDVEYIELIKGPKLYEDKITILLDFGQFNDPKDIKDNQVKDEYGDPLEFRSMMGALNFMNRYGYELMEVYTLSNAYTSEGYYVMRKKKG